MANAPLDWDDLKSFLAIARARTLSGAARELGLRQSTMSRRLVALEQRAGARLLQKTPTGFELTPLGEAVLGNAERMEAEAIAIERAVMGRDVALSGLVRITTVDTLAAYLIPPAVAALRCQHPDICVEVVADGRALSLSRREADIALRLTRFEGHELVARKIAVLHSGLYASPAYLDRYPWLPASAPDDGSAHHLITTLEDQAHLPESRWLAARFPRARIALRSNDREVHLNALKAGVGIGLLSSILAARAHELVELVPPAQLPARDLWMGVHQDLRFMPRIRATMDAIIGEIARQGKSGEGISPLA